MAHWQVVAHTRLSPSLNTTAAPRMLLRRWAGWRCLRPPPTSAGGRVAGRCLAFFVCRCAFHAHSVRLHGSPLLLDAGTGLHTGLVVVAVPAPGPSSGSPGREQRHNRGGQRACLHGRLLQRPCCPQGRLAARQHAGGRVGGGLGPAARVPHLVRHVVGPAGPAGQGRLEGWVAPFFPQVSVCDMMPALCVLELYAWPRMIGRVGVVVCLRACQHVNGAHRGGPLGGGGRSFAGGDVGMGRAALA